MLFSGQTLIHLKQCMYGQTYVPGQTCVPYVQQPPSGPHSEVLSKWRLLQKIILH